jgi:hypothetical protein
LRLSTLATLFSTEDNKNFEEFNKINLITHKTRCKLFQGKRFNSNPKKDNKKRDKSTHSERGAQKQKQLRNEVSSEDNLERRKGKSNPRLGNQKVQLWIVTDMFIASRLDGNCPKFKIGVLVTCLVTTFSPLSADFFGSSSLQILKSLGPGILESQSPKVMNPSSLQVFKPSSPPSLELLNVSSQLLFTIQVLRIIICSVGNSKFLG